MSTKSFTNLVNYKQIAEANKMLTNPLTEEKFYQEYAERLQSHPLNEVKFFDWSNSVSVSLVETETTKVVKTSAIKRANELWKNKEWKDLFNEAAKTFVEDVESGTEKFTDLMNTYPQVFYLDQADRKTLFGKTILLSSDLREELDDILKGMDLLFEKFDLAEMKQEYLSEQYGYAGQGDASGIDIGEAPQKEPAKDKKDAAEDGKEDKKEDAKELTPDQLQKIADQLKKVSEKIEDEDLKSQLDELIAKLEKGKAEGTKPEDVKEAVAILSLGA
jgi:hypothetical protein